MKQKVNVHSESSEGMKIQRQILKVAVLTLIVIVFFSAIPYLSIFESEMNKLALKIELPLQTLRLLIVLVLFVILSFLLSLLCIFKKNIKSSDAPSEPVEKLPPKKYMDKILLKIEKHKKLSQNQICDFFGENKTKIHHYIDLLHVNGYIQLENTDSHFSSPLFREHSPYNLTPKGREYLVENNLLTKGTSHD